MQTFASSFCSRAAPILRVTRTGKPARRRYAASGSKPRGRSVLPSATATTFLPSRYAPAVVTPCGICSISPFCSDSTPFGRIRAATLIAAADWCVFTSTITQSACGSSSGPNASGLYSRPPTRTPRRSSVARAALRAITAVGTTLERRLAYSRPNAPGPMTATALTAMQALQHLVLHAEALPFGRKAAVAHVGSIAGDGVFDRRAGFRVALDEARRKAGEQADQVMEYENLTVAMRACADADGRDGDALGDQTRERRRHQLQHHAPAAGALERLRAFQDAPRVLLVLALQLVAAERRRGLRREPDMA